jgi:hypothetical protein
VENDAEGRIDTFRRFAVTLLLHYAIEPRRPVIELHALEKPANLRRLWTAANAYEVFALNLTGWMHQSMR